LSVLLGKERKDLFMHALSNLVKGAVYGLIAAALMLIGVGTWVVATAPRVVASTQIGVNPLEMMASAKDLPTSYYDF
jgi:hypothetical protein